MPKKNQNKKKTLKLLTQLNIRWYCMLSVKNKKKKNGKSKELMEMKEKENQKNDRMERILLLL